MIHPLVKIIAVDDFFNKEQATDLCQKTYYLQYVQKEFGEEIDQFNWVPADANRMFSEVLGTNMVVDEERSGIFRRSGGFIHFEYFESVDQWVFAVALQTTTFNVYEHTSGVQNALREHRFNYRNLFEWNHRVNYELEPGHGILFRPWLFHSFSNGLTQVFRLTEKNGI